MLYFAIKTTPYYLMRVINPYLVVNIIFILSGRSHFFHFFLNNEHLSILLFPVDV